jgi:NAD(P)H-hydrate epimerase
MEHAMQFAQVRPEIMAHAVEEVSQLVGLMDKASVIAVGPGLGQNSWGESLFKAIEPYKQPKVLDADGLNFLAKRGGFSDNWILTPHPGEAARLMHCSVDEIQRDRYTAARDIQSTYGGVVVLKGPGTIITNGMTTKVTVTGNPGMACGGTGDVLTGIIAAFIAQKMPLMEAAVCGAFLHGKAGDQAAVLGERGLLASDLMPYIRSVVN